jgi:hypothetical protein
MSNMRLNEVQDRAIKLLRQLHPQHDVAWHTICVTCFEITQLEAAFEGKSVSLCCQPPSSLDSLDIEGLQPLTPGQMENVKEFMREMEEKVIPDLVKKRREVEWAE